MHCFPCVLLLPLPLPWLLPPWLLVVVVGGQWCGGVVVVKISD